VNNAARTEFRSFWEIDVDEWDDVLATNLRGTYLGCRTVGRALRERGRGRIVNLASDAAFAASGGSGRGVEGGRRRRHPSRGDRARASRGHGERHRAGGHRRAARTLGAP
jgi:NAD(P)-dependent dehydrogenase (short-subunit alcohol dehydrogenase family)